MIHQLVTFRLRLAIRVTFCAFALLTAFSSPAAHANEAAPDPTTAVSPILNFTVTSPDDAHTAFHEVNVTAAEFYSLEDAEAYAAEVKDAEAVSFIAPDSGRAPSGQSAVRKVAEKIHAKLSQTLKLSPRIFPEWFEANRFRITIIALEMVATTGVKYTELVVSSASISHSVALATGVITGGIIGSVDWNITKVMTFIKVTGTPTKNLFARISKLSKDPAKQARVAASLETSWQFVKNSTVNFALFNVLKFAVYATVQADGSIDHRIFDAFRETINLSLFKTAGLALTATAVSFPTTKVILAFRDRVVARAGGDRTLLLRARDKTMALASSTLTARAILFSSLFVAEKIHAPLLTVTAASGLATMFGGSIWKLILDNRASLKAEEKCPDLLLTAAPTRLALPSPRGY